MDLPNRAVQILKEQKEYNSYKFSVLPEDYIFLSKPNAPLSIHAFNKSLKEAAKEVELQKKRFKPHISPYACFNPSRG